eukprot:scaffold2414_cov164-Ochromonas_danica.AAC.4
MLTSSSHLSGRLTKTVLRRANPYCFSTAVKAAGSTLFKAKLNPSFNTALAVEAHPGSRLYTITQPKDSSIVSTLELLGQKLLNVTENDTVNAVVLKIDDLDLFSSASSLAAYGGSQQTTQFLQACKAVNSIPDALKSTNKNVVSIFNGYVSNAGFSTFYSSKYRVGTRSTRFQLKGLADGVLPVGAHLVHRIVHSGNNTVPMVRFLGVTEKELDAEEMYSLGMLTHVTMEDPHVDLLHAIGSSVPDNYYSKAIQAPMASEDAVGLVLESMHLYERDADQLEELLDCENDDDDDNNHHEIKHGDKRETLKCFDFSDIFKDPVFNEALLVTPSQQGDVDADDDSDDSELPSIDQLESFVEEHFSGNDVEACLKKLQATADKKIGLEQKVAQYTLSKLANISPKVLKAPTKSFPQTRLGPIRYWSFSMIKALT